MDRYRDGVVESGTYWSLGTFLEAFEPLVTPELLVNIWIEALAELETPHRRGLIFENLGLENIIINRNGAVYIRSPTQASPSREKNLRQLSLVMKTLLLRFGKSSFYWKKRRFGMPRLGQRIDTMASAPESQEAARIHPKLRKIVEQAVSFDSTFAYSDAWRLRADLLDFLRDVGVDGERFFVSNFIRDPDAYNQTLTSMLGAHVSQRIDLLARLGKRKAALAELQYLLEMSPGSPQALLLLRRIRQGRREAFARIGYGVLLLGLFLLSGSVIVAKLNLPISLPSGTDSSQPLVIEPTSPEADPDASQRMPAGAAASIEVTQKDTLIPGLAAMHPDSGRVVFELDDDAHAYINNLDNGPEYYYDGDVVWLKPGLYTVTIVKQGYPPVMAQITARQGYSILLTGRVTVQ